MHFKLIYSSVSINAVSSKYLNFRTCFLNESSKIMEKYFFPPKLLSTWSSMQLTCLWTSDSLTVCLYCSIQVRYRCTFIYTYVCMCIHFMRLKLVFFHLNICNQKPLNSLCATLWISIIVFVFFFVCFVEVYPYELCI